MLSKPKFIYFDLDDTLLDHKSAERGGLKDIHEHFDYLSKVPLGELISVYQEVNSAQWKQYSLGEVDRSQLQRNRFEITLQELGIDGSLYSEVGQKYMRFYRDHWEWIEGAEAAFHAIRNEYEVGILTNGFSETQKAKFDRFDLYSLAKYLVISEDVGHLKPHPKIFEHATDLAGVEKDEILYIGDSISSDVKGGTDFGWRVAWFTSNGEAQKPNQANFVFDNFKDLRDLLEV